MARVVKPSSTRDWVRALGTTQRLRAMPNATLPAAVAAMAEIRGSDPALIGMDRTLTYTELVSLSQRYVGWALDRGLARGDVVGLLMENRPEYVAIWLGLIQAGCVVALLGQHLPADALAHSIGITGARDVIVSSKLADQACAGTRWWVHGEASPTLDTASAALPRLDLPKPAPMQLPKPAPSDPALLLFTSGTTGLPKAAYLSHARVLEWSGWFAGMMDATAEDLLYDCLPLCHSTGGVVAVGAMLVAGGGVVIRERFSASLFWDDVAATGCTVFQYVGELCRYLLQSPAQDHETAHHLRLCCGNGLRADVWSAFQERFNVPRILEFYAASEGALSLYNCEGHPGSIGRIPPFLAHRIQVALVRCDPDTVEPLRDAAGRCIRCDVNEPGEAIALLNETTRFEGYTDPAASSRKVLRDVFAVGDRWFRSGDSMRRDADGFYAFVDRMGDTYRWKGENVSTTDVASVLATCPGVVDAVVYGVSVPGAEGKAGMAALVVDGQFSMTGLRAHVGQALPFYARPLFVRICPLIARTETFKLSKVRLSHEDYQAGQDEIWFDDRAADAYAPFTKALRAQLESGALRL